MNLSESISDIRTHLLDPNPDEPNPRNVYLKLQDAAQLLHLEAQNTSTAWDVFSTTLTTSQGQPDYLVSAGFFGKDLRIVTRDQNNPQHCPREVRRCDLQDIDQYYQGPERAVASGHSAVVMAFYRQSGSIFVKIVPTPVDSREYEIWYEGDLQEPMSLGDSPNIAPFQRYRNLKAAISLIPACKWAELEKKDTQERMKNLAFSLSSQVQDYQRAWQKYITSDRQDGVNVRIGYGEGSGYDYW